MLQLFHSCFSFFKTWTVDPSSNFYYRWLGVISFAVMYNLIFIIARAVFWKLQEDYLAFWIVMDYLADIVYLMDMFVRVRTGELCFIALVIVVSGVCSGPNPYNTRCNITAICTKA